jgi:glycosyltransferase involved in cell wall biosynthesis
MPRLLILCEYTTMLGGERSMLSTLPALTAAGFDIRVASPPVGVLADALREHGVSLRPFQTHDNNDKRLPLPKLRSDLAALLQDMRPQLVHANSLSMARIAGPVARQFACPSVGHLRDIVKLSQQSINDLNSHHTLIAVSKATRNFHVAQGLDPQKCVVAYNGVDLDQFCPQQPTGYLLGELALPPTARLIAVIGQLGLRKGTDVAIQAALKVTAKMYDVHWVIAGKRTSSKNESHEFEARLHCAANQAPLVERVHFLGQRADVPELLNECALLIHAARQEPLGRVLLEAAASGVPVVATDVGGTREIFPNESDGAVLVPADDAAALAHEIIALLGDDVRRLALGRAGRKRAERQFDVRQASARLLEIYQGLLT